MATRLYQWDEWFKLPGFTLVAGVHYHCSQASIINQVRVVMSHRGLTARVEDLERAVTVTGIMRMEEKHASA